MDRNPSGCGRNWKLRYGAAVCPEYECLAGKMCRYSYRSDEWSAASVSLETA